MRVLFRSKIKIKREKCRQKSGVLDNLVNVCQYSTKKGIKIYKKSTKKFKKGIAFCIQVVVE